MEFRSVWTRTGESKHIPDTKDYREECQYAKELKCTKEETRIDGVFCCPADDARCKQEHSEFDKHEGCDLDH